MSKNTTDLRYEAAAQRPGLTWALWIVQGLLALAFLFAGGMKLITPLGLLTKQMPLPLPGSLLRFIGVAEVLGAVGLILPGVVRIRVGLTPLAACGLVIIMIGATVYTLAGGGGATALIPLIVGLLAAFVAYGRWSCFTAGRSWLIVLAGRNDACAAVLLD